jgi:hypothetical protein
LENDIKLPAHFDQKPLAAKGQNEPEVLKKKDINLALQTTYTCLSHLILVYHM